MTRARPSNPFHGTLRPTVTTKNPFERFLGSSTGTGSAIPLYIRTGTTPQPPRCLLPRVISRDTHDKLLTQDVCGKCRRKPNAYGVLREYHVNLAREHKAFPYIYEMTDPFWEGPHGAKR